MYFGSLASVFSSVEWEYCPSPWKAVNILANIDQKTGLQSRVLAFFFFFFLLTDIIHHEPGWISDWHPGWSLVSE
jgi:hypothetical protein